jgi:hypothetical protein
MPAVGRAAEAYILVAEVTIAQEGQVDVCSCCQLGLG